MLFKLLKTLKYKLHLKGQAKNKSWPLCATKPSTFIDGIVLSSELNIKINEDLIDYNIGKKDRERYKRCPCCQKIVLTVSFDTRNAIFHKILERYFKLKT